MVDQLPPLVLQDRAIIYRNFAGAPDRFNPKGGNRTFSVILEVEEGERMKEDGWNVKFREPREEGDPPIATLKVNVKYGGRGRPPRVVLITEGKSKTDIDESLIASLDWADVVKADVQVRAWHYDINGSQGVAAYLTALWLTIREDVLEAKYSDIPEAGDFAEPVEPD
jgi:hypothetical protein